MHWAFELNSAAAAAKAWDLKGQILRSERMWSWIIVMHTIFEFNLSKTGTYTVGWHIWSRQYQKIRVTPVEHS